MNEFKLSATQQQETSIFMHLSFSHRYMHLSSCLSLGPSRLQIEEGVLVAVMKEEVTYLDIEATIDELLQDEVIVHDV